MRFLFGLLGAVVGAAFGVVCVVFFAYLMTDGNDFGMVLAVAAIGWIGLLGGAAVGVPLALWAQTYLSRDDPDGLLHFRKLRLVAVLLIGLFAAFVGMLWRPVTSGNPPSDEQLLANFQQHEATFDEIARMAQADKQLQRVGSDGTSPTDPQTIGVAPARTAEYRRLLNLGQVPLGFQSYDGPQNIEFLYWGQGSAISSDTDKGYAYLGKPPAQVLSSLDGCKPDVKNGSLYYRHIQGHWYLYYDYLPG